MLQLSTASFRSIYANVSHGPPGLSFRIFILASMFCLVTLSSQTIRRPMRGQLNPVALQPYRALADSYCVQNEA